MADKIYAVQGDNLPLVTLTITDLDDNAVSIAGCTGVNGDTVNVTVTVSASGS